MGAGLAGERLDGCEIRSGLQITVSLHAAKREWLAALVRTGKHSARKRLRARILLKADVGEAWADFQIIAGLHASVVTFALVRRLLVEGGRADAQAFAELRPAADFQGRQRGQVHRARLPGAIPEKDTPTGEVAAWQKLRIAEADWHFATADARIEPKRLCPTL